MKEAEIKHKNEWLENIKLCAQNSLEQRFIEGQRFIVWGVWVAAWLLCYQTFYKLDIVPGRKIDSDDQRIENPINHVTKTNFDA